MNSEQSAARIKLIREKLGLSQSSFATGLGIPRTTLINYEKNTSIPAETLGILREKYRVNIDFFLTGDGSMFTGDVPNSVVDTTPVAELRAISQRIEDVAASLDKPTFIASAPEWMRPILTALMELDQERRVKAAGYIEGLKFEQAHEPPIENQNTA